MKVIGHDNISRYLYVFTFFQVMKPFINQVISARNLKQRQPVVTGKSNKVKRSFIAMLFAYRHHSKIGVQYVPQGLMPSHKAFAMKTPLRQRETLQSSFYHSLHNQETSVYYPHFHFQFDTVFSLTFEG